MHFILRESEINILECSFIESQLFNNLVILKGKKPYILPWIWIEIHIGNKIKGESICAIISSHLCNTSHLPLQYVYNRYYCFCSTSFFCIIKRRKTMRSKNESFGYLSEFNAIFRVFKGAIVHVCGILFVYIL